MNKKIILNEAIIAKELRVIGEDGRSLGIVSKQEALQMAKSSNLDLVVIALNSKPPVAKIVDWGKYSYQQKKKQQVKKSNQVKPTSLKQVKFGLKISKNDLDIKLKKIIKFLEEGNKVKITIIFRGPEIKHKNLGFKLGQDIISKLDDVAIEQPQKLAGRQINAIIRSNVKHAKAENTSRS